MKAVVAVKRVVDAEVRVRVRPDGSGVDTENVRMAMNPNDEVALEEAVRLKERGVVTEVIAVSCGAAPCQDTLRTALAFGADRAILVETDAELQPLGVAKLLRAIVERERPQVVICGARAIDDDAAQTGQMLAALLGWAQAVSASNVEIAVDLATVTREIDGGTEVVEASLPLVITADLRLNQPRYPSLPNVLKSRKLPVEVTTPSLLGVEIAPRLLTLSVVEAPSRRSGRRVSDVAELVARLRDEARVIP